MKNILSLVAIILASFLASPKSYSQTSWKGTGNTNWDNAANWTSGTPNSGTNVVIGDGNFTGPYQPTVNTTASCNSITIGGAVASTLTLTKNLVVNGGFTISTNGTINHPASTLTVKGDWVNNGNYTTSNGNSKVIFGGNSQLIAGSVSTTFRDIVINAAATVMLGANISATGSGSSVQVKGTLDPGQSPTYSLTSTISFRVFINGNIKVNAATFAANYILSGTVTLSNGSSVEYSSTTVNQSISSAYTYANLIISGSGTKSLSGILPSLNSANKNQGNIFVNSATLDLGTYTANRGTSSTGGSFNVKNGAFLNVGGASNFPANYNSIVLSLGSTTMYNGVAQNVSPQDYGNLILSSKSGAAVKTLPNTDFTIEGNFSSVIGSGTSVSYTAYSNISVNGDINIGTSTAFNSGNFSHDISGNWVNNGTFNGNTGTIILDGPSSTISGSGVQNFNNLSILASGITAVAGTSLNISGNISTSVAGDFTQLSGGLITMTGISKSISGTGIIFNDLTVSGTVSTNTSFVVNGNLSVAGSLLASAGTITMAGSTKTISGSGTQSFSTLQLTGTITTASNFSVSSLMDVSGTLSATSGTATFTGSSVLSGTANLFNVAINGTSLQLSATSVLAIANLFTITSGALNVTSSLPNTVNFNGIGAQNVNSIAYNNLVLSNGNTKTASGNITVNGNITISPSTTFGGGAYTHTVLRNWINNGTFTPSVSTVQFTGVNNSSITGVTSFNAINVNKSSATSTVTLLNNVNASTVNMVSGKILTGTNKITITNTRTGNGIILGTITRTHAFSTGISYAFEGPDNTINFSSVMGVTSITITVTIANINDFPDNASINREYDIAVTGTSYNATLRLHYEDAELNGNNESIMGLWDYSGTWTSIGKSASNSTNNYIEQSGLTNISTRWTCAEIPGVASWNGSISSDWNTAGNWTNVSGTASTPPAATDIVQIGTGTFTNQPTITTAVSIKAITFGSVQAATLTLGTGGSLTTSGNIGGNYTTDVVHTINVGNQNLTVNGDMALSNGVNNRSINLNISSGTVNVLGSFIQKGNASIVFIGAGALNIGSDYIYTSGAFTPGTGTVTYNGSDEQDIALVTYNNLTVNNTIGDATVPTSSLLTINGNLSIISGRLELDNSTMTIAGDASLAAGSTLDCNSVIINAGGNWTNNGTYLSTTGTVNFNGSGTQNISAGTFNNLTINKPSGTANLSGNNTLAGNLSIQQGVLNLSTYTLNRQSSGGSITMSAGTTLQVGGANNFPFLYSSNILDAASTVLYNGTVSQSIAGISYGYLTFSNGGMNPKTLLSGITVGGDLLINSGATFNSNSYSTLLKGNWTNNGTFNASTGTVILNGTGKTLTGNTIFNGVTINGSYTVVGSDMTYNGLLWVTTGASFVSNGHATISGNLTNNGTLIGNGTTTFSGTTVQTIRLVNALTSSSTGIVNFNGTISPILNSNSSPQFATLNINNTAGLYSNAGGTVYIALNVNTGAKLSIDNATYNIYGSFTNAGTVTSTGTINFVPVTPNTIALGGSGFSSDGTVNFGGTGQITLTGKPDYLNTVIISNTNSAGVSPSSDWTVDSDFVVAENAIFNAGSYTCTLGGDVISDGTLYGMTSTFITTNVDADLSTSAQTYFNNLTNTGSLTPQTDYNVQGNFTNNGTYDGSVGTLIMSGSNNAAIGGTTVPTSIAQLTIQKSNNAVLTQNINITNVSFLNIVSGILFTSTKSITQDPGGGILIVGDSATLRLGGSNSLPGFSGYGLNVNSFVDYAGSGTTQAIGNAAIYGNLIVSGTGNKNAYMALTVLGNLSVSAGVLNTSTITVQHTIARDFTMTGGTISGTNSTYVLNGTNDQSVSLLSNLVKLTVNKPSGSVILGSDITVNNILNFTQGNIKTGNYKMILPSTGSVSGAAQGTGWVNGNLQKYVAAGTSVTKTFEVGDSAYYSPASLLFASVSTAGNFLARVTPTDHPQADYSGIDTTKSVNRYWTLTNSGVGFTTATATFNWAASNVDAGANTSNFKTAAFDGTNWLLNTVSNPLSTSINATGCSAFGDFEVGEAISQYKWTGGAMTSDWNNKGNWSGGVPTTTLNTLIPSGITGGKVYPILNSGTASVKGITIQSAASMTVNGAILQVAGDINNSGTLDASNGTIEMNGNAAQSIAGSMFNNRTINNLVISNSGTGLSVSSAPNDTLKITGSLTFGNTTSTLNTGDNITLVSDSAGTASVGIVGSGNTINGDVTVERYSAALNNWQFLSLSTNTAQTIHQAWQENQGAGSVGTIGYGTNITGPTGGIGFDFISPNVSMKYWDIPTNAFIGIMNTGVQFPNKKNGFFVYIRGDRRATASGATPHQPTVLRNKGPLYTGNMAFTLPAKSYYSIGNPYASKVDFGNISGMGAIGSTFYVWDPLIYGTRGAGGYQTLSSVAGFKPSVPTSYYDASTAYPYLESGQAAFVSNTSVSPVTLTFTESDKTTGSHLVFRGQDVSSSEFFRTYLSTASGKIADGNAVAFNSSYQNRLDAYDAVKISNTGENLGLRWYGVILSIEARSPVTAHDTIYFDLKNVAKADYQFRFDPQNMQNETLIAFLADNYLKTETNVSLSGPTSVNFSINSDAASYAADRFMIVFRQATALPVTFVSIKATQKDKNILVVWHVENENNMQQYEVEKSIDGTHFEKVTTTAAKNNGSETYQWIDDNVISGYNYYRVKSLSLDNNSLYSMVVKVFVGDLESTINIYPNPITDGIIHLQLKNQPEGKYGIRLLNHLGQLVVAKKIEFAGGNGSEDVKWNYNLPHGIYQLEVTKPDGNVEVIKVMN